MRTHQLPATIFSEIFNGPISAESVDRLRKSQYSLRRLRLAGLFDQISASPECRPAMAILMAVDVNWPEVIADILLHPPAGVWLVRALRSAPELGYLNSIAVSAAIQARLPFEIDVPATGGLAAIPAIGIVPAPDAVTTTVRETSGDLVPLTRHRIEANGLSLDIQVDDCDPYREFGDPLPPRPLAVDQKTAWSQLLDETWHVLTTRHRRYAVELAAGLRTLTPITSGSGICGASSTAAFGAIAVSMKDSAATLARAIVHELQHSKLNALLELFPLVEHDSGTTWYVPWRDDRRPLIGVLHGIYAFTSDVEFWHVEMEQGRGARQRPDPTFMFALRRHQVRHMLTSLGSAHELNAHGQHLIDAIDQRISACESVAIPPKVLRNAIRMVDVHRVRQLRKLG